MDIRIKKMAKVLIEHSIKVKKGDKVIINGDVIAEPLIKEAYKLCLKKGAFPSVHAHLPGMTPLYYNNANDEQLKNFPDVAMYESKKADKFMGIWATTNTRELSNVDPKKMAARSKVVNPISKVRMQKPWVGTNYPTNALAIEAGMSLSDYEDFLFGAVLIDYSKMKKLQTKLRSVINKGKVVRIVAKNTDLTMSIKNMAAEVCAGTHNVPGGEVFTAPEKYSVDGHVEFSYPAIRGGNEVDGICVDFKKGKVVKATATKNEKFLKTMLATDKGSSYLGELGIGTNYGIQRYTKNLLFDEKIGGTVHLAFGMGYPECGVKNKKNLNDSALHWDIVIDMRKGGKLYVDGKLIQKNGKFLL